MNILRRFSKNSKIKELEENLQIQISNNKILRENLQKEQAFSRSLEVGAKMVKEENAKLKRTVKRVMDDNKVLADMLNDIIVKYNIKIETPKEEKPKRGRRKKGE